MTPAGGITEVEGSGETVGEAKWQAVRELERLHPGIDRDCIVFQVIAEGERGLLGVGTEPARVLARADITQPPSVGSEPASELAVAVREVLERIAGALGGSTRVAVAEDGQSVRASVGAPASEIAVLIGRNGRTVDAIQYVASAIAHRIEGNSGRVVEVDAGGYRKRRRDRVLATATRAAERVVATGEPVALPPMTAVERKIAHTELAETPGVETRSEGEEPERCVVVMPAHDAPGG